MPYATVTLSSLGTSTPVNLNWRGGKPTTVNVCPSSLGVGDFYVQYALDDLQLTAAAVVSWFGISSNTFAIDSAGASHFTSTAVYPDGVYIPLAGPVTAVRINSTGLSAGVLTMKVVQGEGW